MITAKEALDLAQGSEKSILDFLEKNFNEQIKKLAQEGKREYFFHEGAQEDYLRLPLPPILQNMTLSKLKSLGFNATWNYYGSSYVPRGRADDDGCGPSYKNYGIVVKW